MIKYDKLIRDLIPKRLTEKGVKFKSHKASAEEYHRKLREKLQEEVQEFLKDSNSEELADILEVIYALGELEGVDQAQLETLRTKKALERGAFSQRLILEESE